MSPRKLHLDLETYCEANLKAVGAHVYVAHPSFVVTVLAWAFDNGPVKHEVWPITHVPPEISGHIRAGGIVCAHNSPFEHAILNGFFGVPTSIEQMECSLRRALAWGLPAGLGAAGKALGLSVVKDESEKALMQSMGKPRKGGVPWHETDPARLARLAAYCVQDVEAERALSEAIPDTVLSNFERRVSDLDARSNLKGVLIDLAGVQDLIRASDMAVEALNREARTLTGGAVANPGTETAKVMEWLIWGGIDLPDLTKEAVAEALGDKTLPADVVRLLELRQLAARSSVKKLQKMVQTMGLDGRVRGLLQYYGAGRTGRWAGRLIQVQNLPRPEKTNVPAVFEALAAGHGLDPIIYPDPLKTISSCLRGCLVAPAGMTLLSMDLAQIEARVTAWLAGQQDVIETFRRGEDVYVLAARKVGSLDRQLGKVLTLAAGFGMGGPKFQHTAESQYKLMLTLGEAQAAVTAWRLANPSIKQFWDDLGFLVKNAINKPGRIYRHPMVQVLCSGGVLMVKKPNGEKLYYHGARLNGGEICFMGQDQKTKQWSLQRTYGAKLVENLVQSVARDVMAEAILRIEKNFKLVPIMTLHDEAVYEIPATAVDLPAFLQREFEAVPAWGLGLPIASEAKCSVRFGK